jgi:hypothetical protein
MFFLKFPSTILGLILIFILAGCGAVLVNEGSPKEYLTDGVRNPADTAVKVIVPPEQKVIGNFDDGSTKMNPKLYGSDSGQWMVITFGGNTINSTFVVPGGANGTAMAAHVFGTLVDKGDGQYPAFELQGQLKTGGPYDASMFQGIRFYYKCPSDDKSLARRFTIPVRATLPGNLGGTCNDGCYNHWGIDLSTTEDWTQKTYAFGDFKRQPGWGSPINPPDFVDHLAEFMGIQWSNSANNIAGSYPIDYWVDEVEFF